MKYLSILIVFSFTLFNSYAAPITQEIDFNGNSLPNNWNLSITNNAAIANDRLEAHPVDGSAAISTNLSNLSSFSIQYYAQFQDSYWGSYSRVTFGGNGSHFSLLHGNRTWKDGGNFTYITHDGHGDVVYELQPETFDIFKYNIEVTDGQISYSAVNTQNGQTAFSVDYLSSEIDVSQLDFLELRSHHTTNGSTTWLDDVTFTSTSATPEPSSYALMLLGLIGLITFKKRNTEQKA
ncbi:MAG: PEP-CTERM sorting domain-containing protein [Lentisphaeraceae bacterium]|nr:PEP-CTERM sorting domain-containing protein [Lentisphaeraceae bacterium]